jgi:hypothetical protein
VPLAAIAASAEEHHGRAEIGCSICPAMTAMKIAKSRHPCGGSAAGGGIQIRVLTR